MPRSLRIILLWLLCATLPVQGWASAGMLICPPGHHTMTMTGTLPSGADDVKPGTVPDADAMHGAVADTVSVAASADDHLPAAHAGHKHAKGSCTPCASCAAVAALPTSSVMFQPTSAVSFLPQWVSRPLASFSPEAPERPPRFALL